MLRIVLSGLLIATPAKPLFAGWVRSAEGQVQVKSGSEIKTYAAANTRGIRLFAGQQVRSMQGAASLLIFGKELSLKSARGWYVVPDEAKKAPAGRDVYAKYLTRAGRTRDASLAEKLWLAVTLTELTNPDKNRAIQIRLTPAKGTYKVGDVVRVQIRNESTIPLYCTVFDIDPEGTVNVIIPGHSGKPIPAESGWITLSHAFRLALPAGWKSGDEIFKLLATEKPINLAAIQTRNETRRAGGPPESMDSLSALLWMLTDTQSDPDPGTWTSAKAAFKISR